MYRFLVLDFVANYPGTISSALAQGAAKTHGVPLSNTFAVMRTEQATLIQELKGLGGFELVQTPNNGANKFVQVPTVHNLVQQR